MKNWTWTEKLLAFGIGVVGIAAVAMHAPAGIKDAFKSVGEALGIKVPSKQLKVDGASMASSFLSAVEKQAGGKVVVPPAPEVQRVKLDLRGKEHYTP